MQGTALTPTGTVFQFAIAPAPRVEEEDLERAILQKAATFSLSSRPLVSPLDLSHRVLRIEGERAKNDRYLWEITFEGVDLPPEEGPERPLAADVIEEVRIQLDLVGTIVASKKLIDLSPVRRGRHRPPGGAVVPSFSELDPYDDLSMWEDYSPFSKAQQAGHELTSEIIQDIKVVRDGIPPEPGLKPHQSGHIYTGGDKAHFAYVKDYLTQRAAAASPSIKKPILAFLALQSREGTTAAINTYDNQIVTWGTGWGGRGGLARVMALATQNDSVRQLFYDCGFRYLGKQNYEVADLAAKRVVAGSIQALQVVKGSLPLLNMLIHAARGADTREAVLEAQLATFVEGSGNIEGAEIITTQALFTFIAHLKHWAPAYVMGVMEAIKPYLPAGSPSASLDKQIAPLVARYFYGKARKAGWIPSFGQFKLYWAHMRDDGLDCMDDPFIKSPSPPTDGPFSGPVSVRSGALAR